MAQLPIARLRTRARRATRQDAPVAQAPRPQSVRGELPARPPFVRGPRLFVLPVVLTGIAAAPVRDVPVRTAPVGTVPAAGRSVTPGAPGRAPTPVTRRSFPATAEVFPRAGPGASAGAGAGAGAAASGPGLPGTVRGVPPTVGGGPIAGGAGGGEALTEDPSSHGALARCSIPTAQGRAPTLATRAR